MATPDKFTQKEHQAPERERSPLFFRPKVVVFTLLAVVLLMGSLVAILLSLQHRSPGNGTSAHGSGTPAAVTSNGTSTDVSETPTVATPCTQTYPVSGTITRVVFGIAVQGTLTTAGTAWASGPKGQYRNLLVGDFVIYFTKETRVFEQQEQGCLSVSLTSLKAGQHIQIQFDGSVMQSFVPQIVAQQLIIVANGGNGS